MSAKCPFLDEFSNLVDCPYLEGELCDDTETNSGNSDAWCFDEDGEYDEEEY